MKIFLVLLCSVLIFTNVKADDQKYENAMKKSFSKMNSLSDLNSFLDAANSFERIALAEKDKWLPYYYASYLYAVACFVDTSSDKRDTYLDKADIFISIADSLEPDESEIYTLKGMIAQARLQIDPMNRWMKYGPEADKNFKKAMELNPANPRPEYLIGAGLFYTPVQFGGGSAAAKPFLDSSLKKYNEFIPADEFMPTWGKETVEYFLEQIKQASN
jgi:tetratricopeptide (TPR) repeat protein